MRGFLGALVFEGVDIVETRTMEDRNHIPGLRLRGRDVFHC